MFGCDALLIDCFMQLVKSAMDQVKYSFGLKRADRAKKAMAFDKMKT